MITIQPFVGFTSYQAELVYKELKKINPNTVLKTAIPLPSMAYYPVRDRYRADSLLRYLSGSGTTDTILIGLTNRDISTSKGQIFGLGHCKNKTCIMRDAEGEDHLNEEKGFCPACKAFLKDKGWILN